MSVLLLLLPFNLNDPWDWHLSITGEHGHAVSEQQKSDLAQLKPTKIIAIVSGMHIITKRHMLGKLSKKQTAQAAGFSIEDELAATLEDTHIAFDEAGDRLAVVSKHILSNIISELEDNGLSPDVICADYDSVSRGTEFLYAGRLVKNMADGLGFAVESELAIQVLDKDMKLPREITTAQFFGNIKDARLTGHNPINLRQGAFNRRTHLAYSGYKRTLWLACACALAFITLYLGQGMFLSQKTKTAKAEIKNIYEQLFPGEKIPKNPVVKVLRAQATQAEQRGEAFIRLSTILATSVKGLDGVEIVSLGYDKGRAQLSMSIVYNSFDDVERLKLSIDKQGGVFLENGTRQTTSGLVGDAVLKEAS